jgi:hypothetical protein
MSTGLRALLALALLAGCSGAPQTPQKPAGSGRGATTGWIIHQAPNPTPSAAYKWMMIMQEASGRSVDRVGNERPGLRSDT